MSEITNDIKSAIEKNLPSQVGEVLTEKLRELKELKLQHKKTVMQVEKLSKENEQLSEEKSSISLQLETYKSRESSIANDEISLQQRLADLAINEEKAFLESKHADEKVALVKELFKIPFQNRVVRENVLTKKPVEYESVVQGSYDSQKGCNTEHVVKTKSLEDANETKTIEEF